MVTRIQKQSVQKSPSGEAQPTPSPTVKDSAQQIWQAGLGAFTRAQAEGSKAFETLVQEGVNIQRKTQAATEERIAEATQKMASMATQLSSKATGQWDKLENIFEERVAKAMTKLGMPSADDVSALLARMDALEQTVKKLQSVQAKVPTSKTPPKLAAKASPKAPAKVTTKATIAKPHSIAAAKKA
jgi:poly(hydroxyalkanoate) granule-associated protein